MTDDKKELIINQVVAQMFNTSFDDAVQIYLQNFHLLEEVQFILPHPNGNNYVEKFQKLDLEGIEVLYFFESDTLYCLNQKSIMVDLFHVPNLVVKIESCVSLDTQIQSYLYRKYRKQVHSIPQSIEKIIQIKNSHLCTMDCFAYAMENSLFELEYLHDSLFIDNTIAFESYFHKNRFLARQSANRLLEVYYGMINSGWGDWWKRQYKLFYLTLLVMADININRKHLSLYEKELSLVRYFHEKIGMISDREINLAKLFFMHGTNIRFFGKIQKGRKDIIKNLKNMAWDIFHIHFTMNNMTIQVAPEADFTIPFFVTYDERLKDIIPVYKIRSAAYIKHTTTKYFNYILDIIDPIIKRNYFTSYALSERLNLLKNETEKSLLVKIQKEIDVFESKFAC